MEYAIIEVLTNEAAHHGVTSVYNAVLEVVRRRRIAARVHVYRGIAGVYEGGEFSSASLLDISANLPVKIEIVLPAAQVDGLVEALTNLVTEGVVAVRPLDVRHHRSHRGLVPRTLRVMDVMTADPVAVSADAPVTRVTRTLMTHSFKGVPVVDDQRRVVGIVTEEDLITRAGLPVRPGLLASLGTDEELADPEFQHLRGLAVRQVMTAPVRTVQARAPVAQAVSKMVAHHHRTLPVLEGEELVGMVSRLDILMAAGQWSHGLEGWKRVGMTLEGPRLVRDAITSRGRYVTTDATLLDVGRVILEGGVRRVAVVNREEKLVGLVAESDLLRALTPEQEGLWDYLVRRLSRAQVKQRHPSLSRRLRAQTAADIMTSDLVVGRHSEPLAEAIARMVDHGVKELPVVDDDDRFLGFLSRHELLRAMAHQGGGPGETAPQDEPPAEPPAHGAPSEQAPADNGERE